MEESILYRVRLRKGDFEIDVQGDKEYVENKFKELLDYYSVGRTAQPVRKEQQSSSTVSSRDLSLREFIDQYNTTAHTDMVLLIGYYLEKYRNQESFTVTDIRGCYKEIREKLSNAGPFINQNVRKGFLMEAPKKDGDKKVTYSLTRKGIQFIENGLTIPE
jgi:hypothetical protein